MNTRTSIPIVLLFLAGVLMSVGPAYGGNEGRVGGSGAMELLIPVGSIGSALGGSMNAMSTGVEAIHWNPAGMARANGVEAMFSTLSYMADIRLNYFAVASNFGDLGSIGVSVRSLDFGKIDVTTVQAGGPTGETFSPSYLTFGLTYSHAFTDRIYGGFSAKLVSEQVIRTSANGVAFDFGVQYVSASGLKLGVALKNLGPSMAYSGPDLESYTPIPSQEPGSRQRSLQLPTATFELPATLEIGLGYDFVANEENTLAVMGNFQNRNFGSDEFSLGMEYNFAKVLYLRGGYMALGQNNSENIYGPSVGAGVKLTVEGAVLSFDYAYRKVDFFDANQWMTLKIGL